MESLPKDDIAPKLAAPKLREPHKRIRRKELRSFTLFPSLPTELRLKIWKLALPRGPNGDGNRIFMVTADYLSSEANRTAIPLTFVPSSPDEQYTASRRFSDDVEIPRPRGWKERNLKAMGYRHDMQDTHLLEVCRESRQIFTEVFSITLLAPKQGVIRFNQHTIMNIENLVRGHFKNRHMAEEALRKHLEKDQYMVPSLFKTVKNLAISVSFSVLRGRRENDANERFLLNFSSLKHFKFDITFPSPHNAIIFSLIERLSGQDEIERLRIETTNRISRMMKEHKKRVCPEYSIPTIGPLHWT